ncbi:inositol-tetrakisphosphate 1-kinase-like [Polistes fuscatus]|uniref:inositol-tetrakisphosphate 1-kinase-like n=1 Tax=Polistes fuscatus TaxID=30207 RepID=UPI001CA8BC91|nr:inositol-tetrakisphosphate 1-kinase-like [Polistes fuscatus]
MLQNTREESKKMCNKYVIGYWVREKKRQKLNFDDLEKVCRNEGFSLKLVDINSSLESQGPLHVFLHKLVDLLARAEGGDENAITVTSKLQEYIDKHPELIVIDPLENVKKLHNRYKYYKTIQESIHINDLFIPNFVELKSTNVLENMRILQQNNIKFPFVCKSLLAHGTSDAHKMMVIFNKKDLKDCQPPCVAQDFVNHNAILYKVFVVGKNFQVVERPSLRNFYSDDCASLSTLFFNSHDISKPDSKSKWSILSEEHIPTIVKPNIEILEEIIKKITKIFGLHLVGIDIVIENDTKKYAVIDVNAFPGYDGYPNFFQHLVDSIKQLITERKVVRQNCKSSMLKKSHSDDLDSGFESDEKKKWSTK